MPKLCQSTEGIGKRARPVAASNELGLTVRFSDETPLRIVNTGSFGARSRPRDTTSPGEREQRYLAGRARRTVRVGARELEVRPARRRRRPNLVVGGRVLVVEAVAAVIVDETHSGGGVAEHDREDEWEARHLAGVLDDHLRGDDGADARAERQAVERGAKT